MSSELERRIENLEAQIAELKQIKVGPRGEKGSPGDISAAVANAEKVVDSKLAELFKRVEEYARRESEYRKENFDRFLGELDQNRKEVRQSLAQHFSDEATKTRIESLVVHLFQEYGVVSSHDGKVISAD